MKKLPNMAITARGLIGINNHKKERIKMDSWEKLCELITNERIFGKQKRRYGREKSFEDHFSEYLFSIFNWKTTEINRQNKLPIGNGQVIIPDIMLQKNNEKPLIFELKNYTIDTDSVGFNEIKSQIKQASTNYGFFTNGITLHLLYRSSSVEEPEEIFCVPFRRKNDKYAKELCHLLERDSFSTEKMIGFCEKIKNIVKVKHENNSKLFIISTQMSKEHDEKMYRLMTAYIKWLRKNPNEFESATSFNKERGWIKSNILDTNKLRSLSDEEYSTTIHEIHKHALAIDGAGMMKLYGEDKNTGTVIKGCGLIGDKQRFLKCLDYLNSLNKKDALGALKAFTDADSDYKIKGVGQMFWTEMIRCKFGDIPLQNKKTARFFKAIGIELGFLPEQQLQNIGYCHERWSSIWNGNNRDIQMNSSILSHMEHFALISEDGKKVMLEEFDYKPEDDIEEDSE